MRRLALAAFCLLLTACPTDLKDALRQYGYVPVRPASSMWRPGAMVYIKSRDPFEVGFICTASQMMGPGFAPLESQTTNADLAKASKRGFTMAAQVQDIVSADAELQNIKSVKMHLRNVKVFEMTDYDVAQAIRKPNNRCLAAIARRRAQGFEVTLISGAIQADITYSISWEKSSKLDVQAKVAAVQNLSAKLGVDASATSDKAIQASGLIWGVRDDAYLAWLFEPRSMPPVDRGSRLMDPQAKAQLEAMLAGTEPRSMPATPTSEADPMCFNPLPAEASVNQASACAMLPVAASSPNAVVVPAPVQPTTDVPQSVAEQASTATSTPAPQPAAEDPAPTPTVPDVAPSDAPSAPAEPASAPKTQEEWDAWLESQGADDAA